MLLIVDKVVTQVSVRTILLMNTFAYVSVKQIDSYVTDGRHNV